MVVAALPPGLARHGATWPEPGWPGWPGSLSLIHSEATHLSALPPSHQRNPQLAHRVGYDQFYKGAAARPSCSGR